MSGKAADSHVFFGVVRQIKMASDWLRCILVILLNIAKVHSTLPCTCYVLVCTTNLLIHTVICCIHRHIHHMSRTPFLILNFLDFDVYVAMTPIFPANQRRCASSSKNVAILSLWSKRAITCTLCNKLYIGETGR